MARGAALTLISILVLVPEIAWSDDPLARARDAVSESEYLIARGELLAARDAGNCSPAQTAELYRLLGFVEAALGNPEASTAAFQRLLALSPDAALPRGTSPKIMAPFAVAASHDGARTPLAVTLETAANPPAAALVVRDPVALVAKARIHIAVDGGAERAQDIAAAPRSEIALPPGARIAVRVTALDVHGNRLVELAPKLIVAAPAPTAAPSSPAPPPPQPVATGRRPLALRWWPYAAAAVVSGGATAYHGWSAYSAALDLRRATSVRESDAAVERGRRDTLLTNIGFGVTGAFAIAAGAMYLLERRARAELRVAAVPLAGGGAMVLGGTF
jgi:hypothetical protein